MTRNSIKEAVADARKREIAEASAKITDNKAAYAFIQSEMYDKPFSLTERRGARAVIWRMRQEIIDRDKRDK